MQMKWGIYMGFDKEDILKLGLVIGVGTVTVGVITYGGLKLVGKFKSNRGNHLILQ